MLAQSLRDLGREALAERLAGMPAYAGLASSTLAGLLEITRPRAFHGDEEIFAEGEPCESFYLLLSGRVKLCRRLAEGRTAVLSLVGPGDLFGAAAALSRRPCETAAVTLGPIACLEVEQRELLALFERRPALIGELLPVLTRQFVECTNCLVEVTCLRVEVRFAHLLLKLADSVGEAAPNGTFIPVHLSRRELAEMTGTTVETAIRVMSRWSKEGVVETRRKGFILRDRAALEEVARG